MEGHDASKHSNVQAIKMKIHENTKLQNSVSIPLPPQKKQRHTPTRICAGKKKASASGQCFFPQKRIMDDIGGNLSALLGNAPCLKTVTVCDSSLSEKAARSPNSILIAATIAHNPRAATNSFLLLNRRTNFSESCSQ